MRQQSIIVKERRDARHGMHLTENPLLPKVRGSTITSCHHHPERAAIPGGTIDAAFFVDLLCAPDFQKSQEDGPMIAHGKNVLPS